MRKAVFAGVVILGLCGSLAFAQEGGRGGGSQLVILEKAPTDHSIAIPKEKLEQYLKDMDAKKLQTLRMIEGGKFNVNIRRITNAETALVHPKTIDLWVVLEGSGTLTTGGKVENGKIVGGQSHSLKVGDVEFIPTGLPHGVSGVNGNITWLKAAAAAARRSRPSITRRRIIPWRFRRRSWTPTGRTWTRRTRP